MEYGVQPQMVRPPQLYIASVRTELYREILEQNGITHILQVGVELQPSHPQHFSYLQLPVYDMPEQDIVAFFPAAFKFIDAGINAGGGVLVHCQAGISRSATIVIAYCMHKECLSFEAAMAVVSAARSKIWPNMGFKCQLEQFEKLGWDASKWEGWNMSKFLSSRYGDESVNFMSAMLGGAPEDRVAGRQQQQRAEVHAPDEVLRSPFATQRAIGEASTSYGTSSSSGCSNRPSSSRQACSAHGDADSSRVQDRADQRPGSVRLSDTPSNASYGGACRRAVNGTLPANTTARRMSVACCCGSYCGGVVNCGIGRRLRRHSTGQYALAAAAAGVAALQLGTLNQHYPMSAGACLPEETALLMAG